MSDAAPIEVVVAGQTLELELPGIARRAALRIAWEEAGQDLQVLTLVSCAALFLCCPLVQRKAGAPVYQHRVLQYGEAVHGYLLAHGAADSEIAPAATRALRLVLDSFPQLRALEEARGNSTAPSGATSETDSP